MTSQDMFVAAVIKYDPDITSESDPLLHVCPGSVRRTPLACRPNSHSLLHKQKYAGICTHTPVFFIISLSQLLRHSGLKASLHHIKITPRFKDVSLRGLQ